MRIKLLFMLCILLGGLLFAIPSTPALACSCAEVPFERAYEISAVIFTGEVTDFKSHTIKLGDDISKARTITFQVDTVYKGIAVKQLKVYDSGSEASCGYPFKKGTTYLVYAYEQSGELFTSLCIRNAKLDPSGNEDLDQLKKLTPVTMPAETTPAVSHTAADEQATSEFLPSTAIFQIAGAALILLLGAIAYRYLRGKKHN